MKNLSYFFLKDVTSKWTHDILISLNHDPSGFNELLRKVKGISKQTLSDRLKSLERNGLITKHVLDTYPVTVLYEVTEIGNRVIQHSEYIMKWIDGNEQEIVQAQVAFDSKTEAG